MSEPELQPCPHCGAEAYTYHTMGIGGGWIVRGDCDCAYSEPTEEGKARVIEKWNSRVGPYARDSVHRQRETDDAKRNAVIEAAEAWYDLGPDSSPDLVAAVEALRAEREGKR